MGEYKDFDNGRHPHTIVETGEATRTLSVTYKDVSTGGGAQKLAYLIEDESYGANANRKVDRTYNAKGDLTQINEYGVISKYTYSAEGNTETKEDALGNTTTYSDYHRGIPKKEEMPESVTVTSTVNDDGWVLSETNGRGYKTTYTYDDLGRAKTIAPPIGSATAINWTKLALRDVKTTTRGSFTQVTSYDGFGRTICDRPENIYRGTLYDGFGRIIATVQPNLSSCTSSQQTKFTYDVLNRLLKTTHVDDAYSEFTYQDDNKLSLRDEAGKIFDFQYRSYSNPDTQELMAVTGPESLAVSIKRNVLGQATEIDRSGVKRTYDFGTTLPFLKSEDHPETGITTYVRDAIGNVKTKTLVLTLTSYTYDDLNRLKNVDYPGFTPDTTYTYDKNNNIKTMNSGISQFTYTYDKNDNLTQEDQKIEGTTYAIKNTYSNLDHLATISYHDNVLVTYSPDNLGRPTKVLPYVTAATYHPNGTPSQLTYANGRKSTFTINNRQWAVRATTDGGISDQEIAAYDGVGNVKTFTDYNKSSNNRTYTYDGLHRLKTANGPWGNGTITYTVTDDIKSKRMGSTILNYNYIGAKISNITGVPNATIPVAYAYDKYGNVKSKSNSVYGWKYNYDDASNLREVRDHTYSLIRNFDYSGNNMKVNSVSPIEQRHYIYSNSGNLLSDVKISGARPSVHNIYLGSTVVAEVERNVTNPNTQIDAKTDDDLYGYGYGDSNHKHFLKAYFDLTTVTGDVKFCVNGYGINSATEISVSVNGHNLGFLKAGGSPIKSCFIVPASVLLAGRNVVTFTQNNPGSSYGISFLSIGNNVNVVPMIMLLLLDEEET